MILENNLCFYLNTAIAYNNNSSNLEDDFYYIWQFRTQPVLQDVILPKVSKCHSINCDLGYVFCSTGVTSYALFRLFGT